jgi:SAM-dependent methyltransferase
MAEGSVDSIAFYDRNAARFAADTGELDMSALHERFLRRLPPEGRILDAGCGVGRDALAFAGRGFAVVAFDASAEMVRLARERLGSPTEVRRMRFDEVAWRDEFDGIWACASLLHVPASAFPTVAARMAIALRPSGVCYMSFKHGTCKRFTDGRLFTDHTEDSLRSALRGTGLELAEAWVTNDVRAGRSGERWLNAITAHSHPNDQQR